MAVIRGTSRADRLRGTTQNDTLRGADGADVIYGNRGNDRLYGDNHNDYLNGGDGADILYGLNHNDRLYGGNHNDRLYGGNHNDRLYGGNGNDRLYGQNHNDRLYGGNQNDYLNGGHGADKLYGQNHNDRLYGGNQNDRLYGGNHDDYLAGGNGNDYLYGQNHNDRLYGQNDDDYLNGGNGDDILAGGDGNDLLVGGSGDDNLYGQNGDDNLDGGAGADVLDGGPGNDVYTVDVVEDTIALTDPGNDTVRSHVSFVLGPEQENLILLGENPIDATGNDGANQLTGNAANNRLAGGDGDDLLVGGEGADLLIGGAGDDIYQIDRAGEIDPETLDPGYDIVRSTAFATTLGPHQESLELLDGAVEGYGSTNNDTITGNSGANLLYGGEGDDQLDGGDGDDVVDGGPGADSLTGGFGADVFVVDDPGDVITDGKFWEGDYVESFIDFTLSDLSLSRLVLVGLDDIGGTLDDVPGSITGNAGDNRLTSIGSYSHTFRGGDGNDILTTQSNFADLYGDAGDDTLILSLTSTSNKLYGGTGNDTYWLAGASDSLIEFADEGHDVVYIGRSYTLPEHVEDLYITGDADAGLRGNSGDNLLTGSAGANVFYASGGHDTYVGGAGDDTYFLSDLADIAPTVIELPGGGHDTVRTSNYATLPDNVEDGRITYDNSRQLGGLTGNDLDNVLYGNDGDDLLDGRGGADSLYGDAGSDVIVIDATDILALGSMGPLDVYSIGRVGEVDTLRIGEDFVGIDYTAASNAIEGELFVKHGYNFTGFEIIDLTHASNNLLRTGGTHYMADRLTVHPEDSPIPRVDALADDIVDLGVGWRLRPDVDIDGVSYRAFQYGHGDSTNRPDFHVQAEAQLRIGYSIELADYAMGETARVSGLSYRPVVGLAGDLNGDGFNDFQVDDFVLLGGAERRAGNTAIADAVAGGDIDLAAPANAGLDTAPLDYSVSGSGDFNGDGYLDLLVGNHEAGAQGTLTGAVYLYYGDDSGLPAAFDPALLDGSNGMVINGGAAFERAGITAAWAGDFNGDGFDDIVFNAFNLAYNEHGPGAPSPTVGAYVVYGGSHGLASVDVNALYADTGFKLLGSAVFFNENFLPETGAYVSGVGDTDGDGYDDIVVAGRNNVTVVYGRDQFGTLTEFGTSANDVMTGTSADQNLIGGLGNDWIDGAAGRDVLKGGAGDDRLVYDADDFRREGDAGFDTLVLDGSGITLDFDVLAPRAVTGIEAIDLGGSGANTLALSLNDVLALSDSTDTVWISGNDDDQVQSTGQGWVSAPGGNVEHLGEIYASYIAGDATLMIDLDITQTIS